VPAVRALRGAPERGRGPRRRDRASGYQIVRGRKRLRREKIVLVPRRRGGREKKTLPEASSPFAAAAASAAVAASTAGARDGLSAATRARALARAKRRVAPRPAAKPTVSSSLKEKGSDDDRSFYTTGATATNGGASFAPSKRRSDPLAASLSSPCHGPSGASALFNALRRKSAPGKTRRLSFRDPEGPRSASPLWEARRTRRRRRQTRCSASLCRRVSRRRAFVAETRNRTKTRAQKRTPRAL